jgi:general stress protein 26
MASAATDETRKLWDMIRHIRVCMMTTIEEDGSLRSRPMAGIQDEFAGELWFFTSATSHKTLEIAGHDQINLSYADPRDQSYVSVSGKADLVTDRTLIAEKWTEPVRVWSPKGPDDPDLALLRVAVDRAEYWDSPSATMTYLYGYAKARLTGEASRPGENAKIDLG